MDKKKTIELLNKAVAEELSAVHQYMYFHFILDDMGYSLLADIFKKIAIDEMLHIERFAERILFLGGEVEMKASKEVEKIKDPKDMLKFAMKSEEEAINEYNDFAYMAFEARDSGSKKIFEEIISDEEIHFETFEKEYENLKKFGDKYLSQQAMQKKEDKQ